MERVEVENYLRLMIESLEKKLSVLQKIKKQCEAQTEILKQEPFSFEAFDKTMDEKSNFIDELNRLDSGFETMYERVKEQLLSNKEMYRNEIAKLQSLIGQITDYSVSIQAEETRNRTAVDVQFKREQKRLSQNRSSSRIAQSYFTNMNKMNFVDPQFLDKKK